MSRRLLVVTRRFWPLSDEACHRLMAWTSVLRTHGIQVTILTGRWHTSWPAESYLRETLVVRLLPAPKATWNETLFLRNIATWISQHRDQFDVIYVDESGSLLHQVTNRSVCDRLPVIGRFSGYYPSIPHSHQAHLSLVNPSSLVLATHACRIATRMVVPNASADRQLRASGMEAERIVRIPDVPWNPIERTTKQRTEALAALRSINSDFRIPLETPLLIYLGSLRDDLPSQNFLRAATRLLEQDRRFRIWMIGLGKGIRPLHDLVRDAACHHDILFNAPFDCIDELFQVADGLLCLPGNGGWEYYAPQAVAAGVPIIAADDIESKANLTFPQPTSLKVEPTIAGYEELLKSWSSKSSMWLESSQRLRQLWIADHMVENAIRSWVQLLQ